VKKLGNITHYPVHLLACKTLVAVFAALIILALPMSGHSSEITYVYVKNQNNELFVSASLKLDQKMIDELSSGLSKELEFKITLYRHHKIWPNESFDGKTIVISLQSDPIKREYIGTSRDGKAKTVKRFKDISSMLAWATDFSELKLTTTKDLEGDNFFVQVTAESRAHSLPSVVGYILFFLPTKEFSVSRNSEFFRLGLQQVPK
jgi:hypothetical protein